LPIERLAAPSRVVLHMSQHVGSPAIPIVKHGDRVAVGQRIAEATGIVSSPVHASVSGTVISVGAFPHPSGAHLTAIEIENSGAEAFAEMTSFDKPWKEAAPGEIVQKIHSAGIIGMGGGAFPTHLKLSPPSNKPIDTLIINGVECEPYATADHRLMVEKTEEILKRVAYDKKNPRGKNRFFSRSTRAMTQAIRRHVSGSAQRPEIQGHIPDKIKNKISSSAAKNSLSRSLTKRAVPRAGTPMDAGCIVQNVATARAVHLAVNEGTPLFERVITVTGPAMRSPKNLLVKIGTPLRFVLEQCAMDRQLPKNRNRRRHDGNGPVGAGCAGAQINLRHPGVRRR
jgi:electron transport complex protein RnfC